MSLSRAAHPLAGSTADEAGSTPDPGGNRSFACTQEALVTCLDVRTGNGFTLSREAFTAVG